MFMIQLLLIPIYALPAPEESIVRFDRLGPTSHDFSHHYFKPTLSSTVRKSVQKLNADEAFQFNLTCSGVSQPQCESVLQALRNGGRRIAQVLDIKVPVIVKAQFYPFCPATNKQCRDALTLGGAVYGSAFAATKETDRQIYMYPQALVKQLSNENLQYSDSDIIAQFNSDFPYFFRNGSVPMSANLTDFEYVAVHEITHGLGFGTGLLDYRSVYGGNSGYLAPGIFGADVDAKEYSFLNPIDVFDSFVRGSDQFTNIGRRLARLPRLRGRSIKDFVQKFENSGTPFKAAQDAYEISTRGTNTLRFFTSRGTEMQLFSPTNYQQGSSLSHLDARNGQTADFLMVSSLSPGITLERLMHQTRASAVYGPGTIAMLQSIGWSINGSPSTTPTIRIVRNFGGPDFVNPLAGSASVPSIMLTLLLSFVMSL